MNAGEKARALEAISRCAPEDFDGHTDFAKLTPLQRLEWLEHLSWFVYENRGRALREQKLGE